MAARATKVSKQVQAPIAVGRVIHPKAATVMNIKDGIKVTHREYFADVGMPADGLFHILSAPYSQGWAINPGNQDIFPWLHEIALRFETYTFERLEFHYQPMIPTTQSGAIYFAVDYDAVDTAPATKQTMLQYAGLARGPVWKDFKHFSTKEQLKKILKRNTLNQAPPSNADPRLYNVGNLFIACDDVINAAPVRAEVWVDYTVTLQTPQLLQEADDTTISLAAGNSSGAMLANATQTHLGGAVKLRPELGSNVLEFLKNGSYGYNATYTTSAANATATADAISRASGGNLSTQPWGAPAIAAFANGITTSQMIQVAINNAPVLATLVGGALNGGNTLSGTMRFTPL